MLKLISLSLSFFLLTTASFADSSINVTTVTTLPTSNLYTRSNGEVVVKVISAPSKHHVKDSELYHRRVQDDYIYDEPLGSVFYYDSGYRQGYFDAKYRRHHYYKHHW